MCTKLFFHELQTYIWVKIIGMTENSICNTCLENDCSCVCSVCSNHEAVVPVFKQTSKNNYHYSGQALIPSPSWFVSFFLDSLIKKFQKLKTCPIRVHLFFSICHWNLNSISVHKYLCYVCMFWPIISTFYAYQKFILIQVFLVATTIWQ